MRVQDDAHHEPNLACLGRIAGMSSSNRRPTTAQITAWSHQVSMLRTAAAIAQQWNNPTLAEDVITLANQITDYVDPFLRDDTRQDPSS